MTLKLHPEAEAELLASVAYYEEQSAGLGASFLNQVEKTFSLIETFPQLGTLLTDTDRRMLVSKFPYGVIYTVNPDHIAVHAIMHLKKRPGYWKSRR